MEKKEYQEYVHKTSPKTSELRTLLTAFLVGAAICGFGQGLIAVYTAVLDDKTPEYIGNLTSITLIFLGALFTALGLYDKLGAHAGAGSIVPITGFANSVVSPAMESNKEGVIFGIMAKMFTIAGPIIVSGIVSGVVVGTVFYIIEVI